MGPGVSGGKYTANGIADHRTGAAVATRLDVFTASLRVAAGLFIVSRFDSFFQENRPGRGQIKDRGIERERPLMAEMLNDSALLVLVHVAVPL